MSKTKLDRLADEELELFRKALAPRFNAELKKVFGEGPAPAYVLPGVVKILEQFYEVGAYEGAKYMATKGRG